MELKWLEDFVSLAETHSFSRSAELRHVTQPAFSRRIQALEAWLGTELIDRSVYPTRLTASGQVFYEQALAMLSQVHEARTLLRGRSATPAMAIEFAVPHTLSLTYFPHWLQRVEAQLGPIRTRLRALNVHDAVLSLVEGGCDLVMGYHHPSHPVTLDPARYDTLTLGVESISPCSAPARAGRARYTLPGTPEAPTPYLAYAPNAYLGRMTEVIVANAPARLHLDPIYETDMAEGLKAMALAGHGVAFLPHSAVEDELADGSLIRLDRATRGAPAGQFTLDMEIRLYRDKLAAQGDEPRKALLRGVWDAVCAELARGGDAPVRAAGDALT
ncbi:LysR family transcriptional regulator [Burkholderia sp. WAC0059]|uniref:LysR family transcriptional regulator n=1 Tax=Burkholderia sp. WAC0059 TaxID=2066022 RepID=UPI000C7F254F|nr:LysR family transcriptional regulator [Burkholderia sp. WAC0059]PLZ03330.1 LysR family transcriptional regulator [Burkholderia sp. WAC0059]